MRHLRRRYAHAKTRYTWTVGWSLSGPVPKTGARTASFRSAKKADEHVQWLRAHGYNAKAFKWYWDPPHERST